MYLFFCFKLDYEEEHGNRIHSIIRCSIDFHINATFDRVLTKIGKCIFMFDYLENEYEDYE
jgi:hypothetical protein